MEKELKKHICFRNSNDDYIKRLVGILGPIIIGPKPAELINLLNSDKETASKIAKINYYFSNCRKISYKFIYDDRSTKIIFYNSLLLEKTLKDCRNLRFLRSIGYPDEYNMMSYLNHLVDKMHSENIPHEIGVFLGYPLKDVMGFMGHPSLKLTKTNGWRIYGDQRVSDKRYNEFSSAKNRIKSLLRYNSPQKLLLSLTTGNL